MNGGVILGLLIGGIALVLMTKSSPPTTSVQTNGAVNTNLSLTFN